MESPISASLFISGTKPQLDTVTFLWLMFSPFSSVSISMNLTRLSKLSSGSPVPITTTFDTRSPVIFWMLYICDSISDAVRFLTSPPMVDAQNLQPIRQPTWDDMHTELPCLYFMSTLSITFPSWSLNRNLFVPSSSEMSLVTTLTPYIPYSSIFSLRLFGRLVISSVPSASFT